MDDKEIYIRNLFDSIARYYDQVNSIMSMGQDKYWRRFTAQLIKKKGAKKVLDICVGTGKLSLAIAREIRECQITGIDFSEEMLHYGESNIAKYPEGKLIELKLGNAMNLEFADNSFDCAALAFSLRNVVDIKQVLSEMRRVIRPDGVVINLDFSRPKIPVFREIYFFYFYRFVPLLGRLISHRSEPYRYLPASLKHFPDRFALESIFSEIGLSNVKSYPLSGGIVTVHIGKK